ncbi:MAG TPA: hypothetical protein VFM25_01165 [Verrucomicrobiae bacterium]|nr:hypothetical protein [Verrucomicrobiae bacterium]
MSNPGNSENAAPEVFDPIAHREKWLRRLVDELDKIEPLMPIKFLPDGIEYPQWVLKVEREFSLVMFPVAKLKDTDFKMTPKRMGALLGHMCESAVWMKDWIQSQFESPDSPGEELAAENTANRDAVKKGAEVLNGLGIWYCAMRRLAKRALCSSVDQTYEDMTDFLLGYADAFSRKPKTFQVGNIGNPTFEIYLFMLMYWPVVNDMDSVRQLHETLVKVFGANRVGDQKRIEKICQRIGLSFRKPGRPKKIIQTPA